VDRRCCRPTIAVHAAYTAAVQSLLLSNRCSCASFFSPWAPHLTKHFSAASFVQDTIQKEKELLGQGYPDVSAAGAGGPGAPGEGVPPFAAGEYDCCADQRPGWADWSVEFCCRQLYYVRQSAALRSASLRLGCHPSLIAASCPTCPCPAGGNAVLLEETGGNASHLYVDVVGE